MIMVSLLAFCRARISEIHVLTVEDPLNLDWRKLCAHRKGLIRGFETEVTRKGGGTCWCSINIRATRDEDGALYYEGIVEDITDRKQAEEKLKKYSENLEEMAEDRTKDLRNAQEQLVRREKLAILGQLAESMGHELRNPLGIISKKLPNY